MKKFIDVSEHQGVIDWNKVKTQIDGAILRCGYGSDIPSQDDKQFLRNATECERLGIPYGVYLYSYADNDTKANSEANHILRLLKGRKLSYPVYIDVEEEKPQHRAFARRTIEIVGDILTRNGYKFGVYSNLNWWNNYLKGVEPPSRWVAQYYNKCTYKGKYDMWQYSSKGKIDGIKGNVDMNECYFDGVQNVSQTVSQNVSRETSTKKSNEEMALEVIRGKWGNGADRKKRLTDAGYDYSAIQKIVNKMMSK